MASHRSSSQSATYRFQKADKLTVLSWNHTRTPLAEGTFLPEALVWDSEPTAPAAAMQVMRCQELLQLAGWQQHGIQLVVLHHGLQKNLEIMHRTANEWRQV